MELCALVGKLFKSGAPWGWKPKGREEAGSFSSTVPEMVLDAGMGTNWTISQKFFTFYGLEKAKVLCDPKPAHECTWKLYHDDFLQP